MDTARTMQRIDARPPPSLPQQSQPPSPFSVADATTGSNSRMSNDATPSSDPLTNLALQFGGVALRLVRKNLGAQDALSLQATNRPWCSLLRKNEDELFQEYLQSDFIEGPMLGGIVTTSRSLTYKRMYLAFQRKFRLRQRVCIYWRSPHSSTLSDASQDVKSLIFIARIGEHCAEMKWGDVGHHLQLKSPDEFGFSAKRHQIEGGGFSREMVEQFRLTLHCIDLQKCKIMLMEDSTARTITHLYPREGANYGPNEDMVFISGFGEYDHYGPRKVACSSLFGFPNNRALSIDWHDLFYGEDKPEDVEWCSWEALLNLYPTVKNGDTFRVTPADSHSVRVALAHSLGYPDFMLSSEYLQVKFEQDMHRHTICNFFRAVMEEKCH